MMPMRMLASTKRELNKWHDKFIHKREFQEGEFDTFDQFEVKIVSW